MKGYITLTFVRKFAIIDVLNTQEENQYERSKIPETFWKKKI